MVKQTLNEPGSGRQPTPTKRKGDETMRKYKVIMRLSSSKMVFGTEYFDTPDDAIDFIEEQRADDFKHGEADEYEYEFKNPNK